MDTYNINLDTPPHDRWSTMIPPYKTALKEVIKSIINTPKFITPSLLSSFHPLPTTIKAELVSIAKVLDISYYMIYLFNIIITSLFVNNTIISKLHPSFLVAINIINCSESALTIKDLLKNLFIKVNFIRNNTILYSTITIAGFVGIFNAVTNTEVSISLDEGGLNYVQGSATYFALRSVLDTYTPYDDIIKKFTHTKYNKLFTLILTCKNNICIINNTTHSYVGAKTYFSFELDNKAKVIKSLLELSSGRFIQHCNGVISELLVEDNTISSLIMIPKGIILNPTII